MSEPILLLAAAFVVVALLVKIYAWVEHSSATRKVIVKQSCIGFIEDVFGISREECARLRFNGQNFVHDIEVSPSQYQQVSYAGCGVVEVFDASIPHIEKYKHINMDGGPDLRVSSSRNPKKMESKIHTFLFSGDRNFKAKFYDLRYSFEIEESLTAEKCTKLLLGLSDKELKGDFDDYIEVCQSRRRVEEDMRALSKENSSYLSIMASFEDLKLTESPFQESVELKKEVGEKYKSNLKALTNLEVDLSDLKSKEKSLISSAKIRLSSLVGKKTLSEHGFSLK